MALYAKVAGTWRNIDGDTKSVWAKVAGAWVRIGPILYNEASGGQVRTFQSGGKWYRTHTFTSSGQLTVSKAPKQFRCLVVAGGGGGGSGVMSGGGGAGGMYDGPVSITVGQHAITVGDGGAVATNGQDSSIGTVKSVKGGGAGRSEERRRQ